MVAEMAMLALRFIVSRFMGVKMRVSGGNFKAVLTQMQENTPHLLIFGPGYSAKAIAARAQAAGWRVSGTYRSDDKRGALVSAGIEPVSFNSDALLAAAATASHWLVSIAPREEGDPVLAHLKSRLNQLKTVRWIGYLSSTNVYGDHGGGWVDEDTPPSPSLARGQRRLVAENAWIEAAASLCATLHIFRLAGIYGPGRNAIRSLLDGRARRIIKPGQLFSRIHVADIAEAVWRAMAGDMGSMIFNLADDEPAPPQDVIAEAARLLGVEPPPEVALEDADMSAMARSFYAESKRVKNDRLKDVLGVGLKYPSYRDALPELVKSET